MKKYLLICILIVVAASGFYYFKLTNTNFKSGLKNFVDIQGYVTFEYPASWERIEETNTIRYQIPNVTLEVIRLDVGPLSPEFDLTKDVEASRDVIIDGEKGKEYIINMNTPQDVSTNSKAIYYTVNHNQKAYDIVYMYTANKGSDFPYRNTIDPIINSFKFIK
jgi:hypothetical protein